MQVRVIDFDLQEMRQTWKEVIPKLDINKIICIDESGVNIDIQGSINGKKFLEYLKVTLVPLLKPYDIVIMDNFSVHKVPRVKEMITAAKLKNYIKKAIIRVTQSDIKGWFNHCSYIITNF